MRCHKSQNPPTLRRGIRRLNPFSWRRHTVIRTILAFYVIGIPVYLFIGLQPADAQTSSTSIATTTDPAISVTLSQSSLPTLTISNISLSTPVQSLSVTNHTLVAPDTIAGSYSSHTNKTLLIGHSSTVFQNLTNIRIGDEIVFNDKSYHVIRRELTAKESINMKTLLKAEKDDLLVLMTCAGEPLANQDATHRLLITAIETQHR